MIANCEPLIKLFVPKKVNDASQLDQLTVSQKVELLKSISASKEAESAATIFG